MTTTELTAEKSATGNRTGLYLAFLQLVFTLGWTTYVIYLPKLAAQVGIAPAAVILVLMMDQAIFTITDTAMGIAADRIATLVGRLGMIVAALTALSGDSVITRAEAARLRNENLTLHKQLEERPAPRMTFEKSQGNDARKAGSKRAGQTYIVQSGDTLFSISRKFYKSPKRWKAILEANKKDIRNPKDLTVGQTLVIP